MTVQECLPRETLKKYLHGWTDAAQSQTIEAHLQECESCEDTIVRLEQEPDTLLELCRYDAPKSDDSDARDSLREPADGAVQYAISRAKRLPQEPIPLEAWKAPVQTIGPYDLISPLGQGGMGAVYLARHRQLNKNVAIKLLPARPFQNQHFLLRFQREIRAVGQLNHPAIVSATDAGELDGTHFLVMEYIDGRDLSRLLKTHGPLSIADACAIVHKAALGLSYAHAEGIVHRDIKPSNLMLRRDGEVKILDFGLAQANLWDEITADLTTVGQLMGTLDYMAPEQAEHPESVDYRADIYSLGATLFRLLTGRPPLVASPALSPLAKLRLIAETEPPSLKTLRPDAPEGLVQLTDSMLARRPTARPSSAAHVAQQLEPFTAAADLESLIVNVTQAEGKAAELPGGTAEFVAAAPAQRMSSVNHGRRNIGNWIMAACLPFLVAAAIFITLETQKGQLIIESEDANLRVNLLSDGKICESLQVVPGENVTKLYAGKYEVQIDGGSDRYIVDKDVFTLQRGDKVVAKLTQKPAEVANVPASSDGTKPELLYQGKTLDQWMNKLELERAPEEVKKALAALSALRNEENRILIKEFLLRTLPDLQNISVPARSSPTEVNNDSRVDSITLAFRVLKQTCSGTQEYVDLLCSEVRSGNDSWANRILYHGFGMDTAIWKLAPVQELAMELASNPATRPSLMQPSLDLLLRHLVSTEDDELAQRMYEILLASANSDLLQFQMVQSITLSRRETIELFEYLAVNAIKSGNTSDQMLAQASFILAYMQTPNFGRKNATRTWDADKLRQAILARLDEITNDPERLQTSARVNVGGVGSIASRSDLSQLGLLPVVHNMPERLAILFKRPTSRRPYSSAIALIKLAREISLQTEVLPYVQKILDATSSVEQAITLNWNPRAERRVNVVFELNPLGEIERQVVTGGGQLEKQTTSEEWFQYNCYWNAFDFLPEEEQKAERERRLRDLCKAWASDFFKAWDTNMDGQLAPIEIERGLRSPEFSRSVLANTNIDKLNQVELIEQALFDEFVRDTANADPNFKLAKSRLEQEGIKVEERWSQFIEGKIQRVDVDNNGVLTNDEWPPSEGTFGDADLNKDGAISFDEFYKHRVKK